MADYHFAPTDIAKQNLVKEGISEEKIHITGNTVIDALLDAVSRVENYDSLIIKTLIEKINFSNKIILVTGHRRENHGNAFVRICNALKEIARNHPDVEIVYPIHLNPNIYEPAKKQLNEIENIHLISPLPYPEFIWLMNKSYLILTDSGGIQEEAPSLGKPVLVMRDNTERPEAVEAGTATLVGTNLKTIYNKVNLLISNQSLYTRTTKLKNPYGDGKAAERIGKYILNLS